MSEMKFPLPHYKNLPVVSVPLEELADVPKEWCQLVIWISVDEALPPEEGKYLVYRKAGSMEEGGVSVDEWYGDYWRWDNHYRTSTVLTHWMPMPKPPKEFCDE